MGIELVEGQDLFVRDEAVFMRTTQGPQRVDVIYRRIDDDFLDPAGVPAGLHAGRARACCAPTAPATSPSPTPSAPASPTTSPSTPTCPEMIRFYLGEAPIIGNVHTWMLRATGGPGLCAGASARARGQGGPRRGRLRHAHRARRNARPRSRRFAGRSSPPRSATSRSPRWRLSTCPTFAEARLAPRHIDLRPFVLSGRDVTIVPGGLTRVALREGSLVVNSSQGGGTKDTWVLEA